MRSIMRRCVGQAGDLVVPEGELELLTGGDLVLDVAQGDDP